MSSLTKPDVALIANCTSPKNRIMLIKELGEPNDGFFAPMKFSFKGVTGWIIALDIMPNDILEKSGMQKAKDYLANAIDFLVKQEAKVIAFTASTKRLPGKSGQELKEKYPDTIFTIGDNGTIISFLKLIDHFLPSIDKKNDQIVCMGAGFLGEQVIQYLIEAECENLTIFTQQKLNLPEKVKIANSLEALPRDIKLFLSCAHKNEIDPQAFKGLMAKNSLILDVAVPPGINRETFLALPKSVRRFDAGDFYLKEINIHFPIEILGFPNIGFWFGCWTEATLLAQAILAGENLKDFNFFEVNGSNQRLIHKYLKTENVFIPLINFFDVSGEEKIFNF